MLSKELLKVNVSTKIQGSANGHKSSNVGKGQRNEIFLDSNLLKMCSAGRHYLAGLTHHLDTVIFNI